MSAMFLRTSKSDKVIRAQTIWSRLRTLLDPSGRRQIDPDDKYGKHIRGGADALAAFANVLNKHPPFESDGLALVPGDLRDVVTIGDIGAAIVTWYRDNGWKVTI